LYKDHDPQYLEAGRMEFARQAARRLSVVSAVQSTVLRP